MIIKPAVLQPAIKIRTIVCFIIGIPCCIKTRCVSIHSSFRMVSGAQGIRTVIIMTIASHHTCMPAIGTIQAPLSYISLLTQRSYSPGSQLTTVVTPAIMFSFIIHPDTCFIFFSCHVADIQLLSLSFIQIRYKQIICSSNTGNIATCLRTQIIIMVFRYSFRLWYRNVFSANQIPVSAVNP